VNARLERPLDIPVILGSIRKDRRSRRPAEFFLERLQAAGHETRLLDLKELALPFYDEEEPAPATVREFLGAMDRADATVWVAPEYNHAFPAPVKNAIEHVGKELRRKPAAVCGVTKGALGGARGVELLKLTLIDLHVVPIRGSVYFADAGRLFDESGRLLSDRVGERVDEVIAELAWYARALRWGRESLH
jgi:NAD(P)H-dependent FMN reductase